MKVGSSLIGAIIGGIIATSVGIFIHYYVGERKEKRRLCIALYDELKLNQKYLRKSFVLGDQEYSAPYPVFADCYTDARNYGLMRELPEGIGIKVEGCYVFLRGLETHRHGVILRGEDILLSEPKNPTVDEVVEMIEEVLPDIKEFYCNLWVYPQDYVAYIVRKVRRKN